MKYVWNLSTCDCSRLIYLFFYKKRESIVCLSFSIFNIFKIQFQNKLVINWRNQMVNDKAVENEPIL